MAETATPYLLFWEATRQLPNGLQVPVSPSDPDATVTVTLVQPSEEVLVRTETGDLETKVRVIPVDSMTRSGSSPQRRSQRTPFLAAPTALSSIPTTDQRSMDVSLAPALGVKLYVGDSRPKIIAINAQSQPR